MCVCVCVCVCLRVFTSVRVLPCLKELLVLVPHTHVVSEGYVFVCVEGHGCVCVEGGWVGGLILR